MLLVFNIVLPIFAIIFVAYLAGRFGLIGGASSIALNRFVYWFALPALLFKSMAEVDSETLLNGEYLLLCLFSTLAPQIIGLLIAPLGGKKSLSEAAIFGLNSAYGNVGYLGIPLMLALFGSDAAVPTILFAVVCSTVTFGLCTLLLEFEQNRHHHIGKAASTTLLALLKNPVLMSPVAGVLWSYFALPLPQPLMTFCDILGNAAGPCALFALGLFLVGQPLTGNKRDLTLCLIVKLLIQPIMTWYAAYYWFDLPALWCAVITLMATLPTAAGSFVLAQHYGVYVRQTSAMIAISSILSIAVVGWVANVLV